ncbi:hypothetical protein [Rhizobacter sp. SG703]|uniref:hypothetical protein n=1 Tax=Rhizobacter sp. SG703 TaxID=2587140 RepID=UPI0014457737|nr:hypothetical protein [Rhizobacter sp. SG703]NKI95174.1 hypothetical protein [Rhizobacter sp. SG703]
MSRPIRTPRAPLTLLSAALLAALSTLAACGGGGSDAADEVLDADTATSYGANAALLSGDAATALDTSVLAAQSVVATQATVAAAHEAAQRVSASAVTNLTVDCAGGGTALLTIAGGSAGSVLNGQLDTGEVYTLAFMDCRGAAGAAVVNGALELTVLEATAGTLSVTTEATGLSVALPRGSASLNGITTRSVSSTTDGNGTTQLTSHFTSPSLALTTHYNGRTGNFTLSAADITRQATLVNGVLQASSINGTHTLSATLPSGSSSYTVATQGSATYDAAGLPTGGAWTITLPRVAVGLSIADALATITVDQGKDGTIDRRVTVPVSRLASDAG